MSRLFLIGLLCLTTLTGCGWVGRLWRAPDSAPAGQAERAGEAEVPVPAPAPAERPPRIEASEPIPPAVPGDPAKPAVSTDAVEATEIADAAETSGIRAQDLAPIGAAAFEQLKAKSQISADYRALSLVRCVASRLISAMPDEDRLQDWEVLVFDEPGVLAFALPGARIGVHADLLRIAITEGQLAGAISHALAHLRLGHLGQRLTAAISVEDAEVAVHVLGGTKTPAASAKAYSMLGLGHRVGTVVPYSDTHEAQTDIAALELLLGAGYRPEDARAWWRVLVAAPTAKMWLAQHPAPTARLRAIETVAGTENLKPKEWCLE